MRRFILGIVILGLGAGGYWVYRKVFPPPEVVIRKTLREMAQAASWQSGGSPLAAIAGVNRLVDFFSEDTEIDLGQATGLSRRQIRGRDELRELVAGARTTLQTLDVRLRDLYVEVHQQDEATAQIIAGARVDRQEDEIIQELRLTLVKEGRAWRIRRVEPVRSLQL